jgi:hypothetical protein
MKRYIVTIFIALVGTLIGADFNRDGKPDLLLVNHSTRQTAIWHMNNHNLISQVSGPTVPTGWTIVGIGDFNRDGYPDVLIYKASSHQTSIWHMRDGHLNNAVAGPTFINGYVPVAVATFIQNGVTIMAFNPSTRQLYAVNMNDNTILSQFPALTVPWGWQLVSANGPPQLRYPNIPLQNNDGPQYRLVNPATRQTAIWNVRYDVQSHSVTFINGFLGVTIPVGQRLGSLLDANLDSYLDYLLFSPSDGRTSFWYLRDSVFLSGIYGPRIPTGWATSLIGFPVCAFGVRPTSINAPATYSTHTITVDTGWDCTWTATSTLPWITIGSILPKRGPSSIYIAVAALPQGTTSRSGTITVAGQPVTVSQGGGAGVTGHWVGTMTVTAFCNTTTISNLNVQLTQTGSTITGTFSVTNLPCYDTSCRQSFLNQSGTIGNGTINGNNINFGMTGNAGGNCFGFFFEDTFTGMLAADGHIRGNISAGTIDLYRQ